MKALSIRQPWIDAIITGAKTVGVRARPTRHRGPLYLHASRTYGPAEREQLPRLRGLGHELPEPDRGRLGALVAQARLLGCRPMRGGDWPAGPGPPRTGRDWAWVLSGPRRLRTAV